MAGFKNTVRIVRIVRLGGEAARRQDSPEDDE